MSKCLKMISWKFGAFIQFVLIFLLSHLTITNVVAQDRIERFFDIRQRRWRKQQKCTFTHQKIVQKYYQVLYANLFYTSLEKILLLTTAFEARWSGCRSVVEKTATDALCIISAILLWRSRCLWSSYYTTMLMNSNKCICHLNIYWLYDQVALNSATIKYSLIESASLHGAATIQCCY